MWKLYMVCLNFYLIRHNKSKIVVKWTLVKWTLVKWVTFIYNINNGCVPFHQVKIQKFTLFNKYAILKM